VRSELGVDLPVEEVAEIPVQVAEPADVLADDAARFVHVSRRDEVAGAVELGAHVDAAFGQRVGDGACAAVAAAYHGDH